jgi:signal transduction histidine kinase/DNA-binding response OmpR family regulator
MTPVARVLGRLARLKRGSSLLLRLQIALIVLVALGLVWGTAYYERERSAQSELREAEVRTAVQAHVFAEYSRSTVKRINELILDTRAQWHGDWRAFGELIARRQEFIGDIAFQVSVLDRDGMLAFSSLARPGDRADLSAREHFLVHRQGGNADRLFISRPIKGKVSGKWSLQFTRPILKDGVFDGVLVVSVSPELFGGFAAKLRITPASAIVVTRDSGEIMARYPAVESSYGMRLKSKPFTEPDAAVSGNYRYVARVDGAERIYGYYKLPEYGLVFLVGESIADILAPQAAHRRAIAKLAGGVSLFVLLLYLMLFGSLATLDKVRRQLESEKERADAANHAKSEFLAMMSHEIRTPLTSIMGFAQLLDAAAGDGVRADAGQIILRNGQYLLDIINDILDISKVEAGRLQLEQVAFSPLETVRGIGAMMSAQAHSKGIAFHIDVAYPMPAQVLADPTRWKQILFNLCGNAIKFTELGEVRLRLSYDAPRALLCCRVSDTGIGISPQQMAVLFQPFAQADRAIARQYGGTGLGLHLVQQLAEKMGGAVSADSTLGRGAVFDVSIAAKLAPGAAMLERAPEATAQPAIAPPAPVQGLRGRVLLAEDGPDNRKLIGAFLKRVGLDYAVAENGAEALEQALRDDFDVILMDVQMPVLDGVGATRALRAAGCGVPIVALTANVMAEDVERYLAAGCTRWVGKPIDFNALAQCLAQLLPQPAPAAAPALSGEKLDGYAKICRAFAAGLPERLAQLQACIAAGQREQAAELLHMLKGSAGSFGYPRVTDCAREMEQAIRDGQPQAAVQNMMEQLMMLDEVSQLYRREEQQ